MPTHDKLFTIVLPVRNGGSYVRDCVASVLALEGGDFDFHILDNASTDGTLEWLLGLKDPRISVTPSPRSLSIEENWARILQVPKNEYLTIVGHDDLLDPDFLIEIKKLINRHPQANLYLTHFRLIDREGSFINYCLPMPERETAAEFLASRLCRQRHSFGTGHVFRGSNYDAIGGIPPFPRLLFADDALFIKAIGASYRATSSKDCFSYRFYGGSTGGASTRRDSFLALETYAEFLKISKEEDPEIARVLSRHFANYVLETGLSLQHDMLISSDYADYQIFSQRIRKLAGSFGDPRGANPSPTIKKILFSKAENSAFYRGFFHLIFLVQHRMRNLKELLFTLLKNR